MKQQSTETAGKDFDFLAIVYNRLVARFADEIDLKRAITVRELNQYLALQFSLDRKLIRKLLKALACRYPNITIFCRGIKINSSR